MEQTAIIPTDGAREPVPGRCNSPRKGNRGLCSNPAGFKTAHVGIGRCLFHGGNVPIKHGRYSKILRPRIAELIAELSADPLPTDTLPEIVLVRAFLIDYVERYDLWSTALIAWHESFGNPEREFAPKPMQILDLADAYRMASEVSKMVERHVKIEKAVPLALFLDFMRGIGKVISDAVTPEQWETIRTGIEGVYVQMRVKMGEVTT